MSGMQGMSGTGSMPKNCGMQGMHENYRAKQQDIQADTKNQIRTNEEKIPNPTLGNKFDAKI